MEFPDGVRFMKLDVKDFYMTGGHNMLVTKAKSLLDEPDRKGFELVASAILENQYVASDFLPGKCFRVKNGTGMGMISSGHISDSVLFALLERSYIMKPSIRRQHKLLFLR